MQIKKGKEMGMRFAQRRKKQGIKWRGGKKK